MNKTNRTFRERLLAGEALLGTFQKTPDPIISEVLGSSALDAVCIDAEHAPFDRRQIDGCIHALRSARMPSLVRVPAATPEHLLNALDCGASGVVVPHIMNAQQARAAVAACHYGRGGRGYAGSSRAAAYTGKKMSDHLEDSALETTVILQIEDVEALQALDEIARVPGVDCLFIGRIDLTVSLGADSPESAVVVEAVERICAAGRASGVATGMFLPKVSDVRLWAPLGASLFLLESDHGFLLKGAAQLRQDFEA